MSVTRYEMTIHLETDSPLHSGGMDEVVDRTRDKKDLESVPRRFARDGEGKPVLTGRSVKGALRAACKRYVDGVGAEAALGDNPMSLWGGVEESDGWASALTFHPVSLDEAIVFKVDENEKTTGKLVTRTGIAVDRFWGTAGNTALFEHEYVPDGRPLILTITAQAGMMPQDPAKTPQGVPAMSVEPEQVERLFAIILGLLQHGQVAFGGRRNAGWGRVRLAKEKPWTVTKSDLSSRDGLQTWLSGGEDITKRVTPVDVEDPTRLQVSIGWCSPTGILVAEQPPSKAEIERRKAERKERHDRGERLEEDAVPTEPLRTVPPNGNLVLPGSSVRGALRSRASRIARTVLAARGELPATWDCTGVHDQLAQDPQLVKDLFGSTEHRGALSVLDTLAAGGGTKREVTHNAGDRWTGGVAEGALYKEEVHDVPWNEIRLELDLTMLGGDAHRQRAAWCLLGLTLAELAAGTLPLGSRGTRGLGQVRVERLTVSGGAEILGEEPWSFAASGNDAPGQLAEKVLERLREVNGAIERCSAAEDDWTGWSSYLAECKENDND